MRVLVYVVLLLAVNVVSVVGAVWANHTYTLPPGARYVGLLPAGLLCVLAPVALQEWFFSCVVVPVGVMPLALGGYGLVQVLTSRPLQRRRATTASVAASRAQVR